MANNVHLKPKFELLNSNFDGYKLKADDCDQAVHIRQIESGIFENATSDRICYLFTRMESLENHLFSDPFDIHTVYIFNKKGHLLMLTFADGFLGMPAVKWQEEVGNRTQTESADPVFFFSPSVSFPSSSIAITSNGSGLLNILETGDRNGEESWVNLKDFEIPCGRIISSILVENAPSEDKKVLRQEAHVLLLSVTTPEDLRGDPHHCSLPERLLRTEVSSLHLLHWHTLGFDGSSWASTRERRIAGFKCLEHGSLDETGARLLLLSHDEYYFVYDSAQKLEGGGGKKEGGGGEKQGKDGLKYIFMQNGEEIKMWVNAGPDVAKKDVRIEVEARGLSIAAKEQVVLSKRFLRPTESAAATWQVEDGKIEICIPKAEENCRWDCLFEGGDAEGEEVADEALLGETWRRLAHLTADLWASTADSENPAFNPGQLEACDDASEDLLLCVLDGSSHRASHSAHLGAVQHLFNVKPEGSVIPSFCLRHDVDGVLWRPGIDASFDHVATFHAFGYVRASKAMAKFTLASPDNSYVAVADVDSHVYVFCQPGFFGGELRNRRTGDVSATIARQLIMSLRNHDQVMGFHCAPNCIFVLTKSDCFVYTLDVS